ncbi:expressed unknown protein [Seminavis robusta]|uniref:Uncharacterized protein n=1 Tax=Seminavis robusta TaxID=568900 RepID=A0A9N8HGU2_9STRA|nr:expressed unknown protein [Seminavis robusta]|eukprot:Sro596_g172840.1 n/a (848) ;mRNA; r:33282-35825
MQANSHPMCGQQQQQQPGAAASDEDPLDSEKLLFWQLAKKLCSQRRRAERSVVKAYRQQQHDEQHINIPAEIMAGVGSSAASARSAGGGSSSTDQVWQQQQKDAAWLFAPTTTEDDLVLLDDPLDFMTKGKTSQDEDDNSDDASCVSDVTRELQDIDAPALYPSLDVLAEVPDIEVKEHKEGKIEVSSHTLYPSLGVLLEEDFPDMMSLSVTASSTREETTGSKTGGRGNWRSRYPRKVQQQEEDEYDLSNLMMPATPKTDEFDLGNLMMPETPPEKKSHPTFGTPSNRDISLIPKDSNSTRQGASEASAKSKQKKKNDVRRQRTGATCSTKGSSNSPDRGFDRTSTQGSPKQPQRRLSLDSRRSGNLLISENDEKHSKMDLLRRNFVHLERDISAESPVQPQRRRSIGSLCSKSLLDMVAQKYEQKEEEEELLPWRSTKAPDNRDLQRNRSTASPMPPRRRRSFDSQQLLDLVGQSDVGNRNASVETNNDRSTRTPTWEELSYGGTVNGSRYGGKGAMQGPSVEENQATYQNSNQVLSPRELGYCEDEQHQSSPRLPGRRASFSSFIDDNSTIATETLGLYKRRKSIDSTVAEPLFADKRPDRQPARPKRQMSINSAMHNSSQSSFSRLYNSSQGSFSRLHSLDESNQSPYGMAGMAGRALMKGTRTHSGNLFDDVIKEESGHPSSHGGVGGGSEFPERSQPVDTKNSNHQYHQQGAYYTEHHGNYKRRATPSQNPLPHENNHWNPVPRKQEQQRNRTELQVEIQPGVFQHLRGSAETLRAIEQKKIQKTTCMSCTVKLFCVPDAEYVLCPVCRVVSPIATNFGSGGGVGLGIESSEKRYRPGAQA